LSGCCASGTPAATETTSCPYPKDDHMLQEKGATPAAPVAAQPAGGLRWRQLLEDRWQARLRDVTELSLAYCRAADVVADGQHADEDRPEAQRLLDR
jgi:hypothetical protein